MTHIFYFFSLYLQTLSAIVGLFFIGFGFISPFCTRTNWVIFSAPMAGIFFIGISCALFYGALGFSFPIALLITSILGLALSSLHFYQNEACLPNHFYFFLKWALGLIALLTLLTNYQSIRYLQPTLLYIDGTDHLGYAGVAQWILFHSIKILPQASPQYISQSWPAYVFTSDPRFGVYYFYAALLWFKKLPAQYLYNFVVGVALSSGIISLLGIFTKQKQSFLILALLLIISPLFDYGQAGFLGKLIAFPSVLIISGLFIFNDESWNSKKIIYLFFLMIGVTTLYPGDGLSFLLLLTLFLPTLTTAFFTLPHLSQKRFSIDALLFAVLLVYLPMITRLTLPHPLADAAHTLLEYPWHTLMLSYYSLSKLNLSFSLFPPTISYTIFYLTLTLSLIIAIYAFRKKNAAAFAFLFFPILLLGLAITQNTSLMNNIIHQTSGIPFLLLSLAVIHIREENPSQGIKRLTLLLIILMIVGAGARFSTLLSRNVSSHTPAYNIYLSTQMDQLKKAWGQHPVLFDVKDTMPSLFLVMEYADKKDLNIYWTPLGWYYAVGYRPWQAPAHPKSISWWLESVDTSPPFKHCFSQMKTNQYILYDCSSKNR